MPSSPSNHVCPYATALSDDEDGDAGSSHTTCDYLSEARKKCPAFANNAPCPFRNVRSDPESLMEVMKKVPPSHYHFSGGDENDNQAAATTTTSSASTHFFQLAMEHVHHVSSTLSLHQNLMTSNDNNNRNENNDKHVVVTSNNNFIIPGGCPFKAYHRRHHRIDHDHTGSSTTESTSASSSSSRQLLLRLSMTRVMEDLSVSAIMGRMATENNNNNTHHHHHVGVGVVGEQQERSLEESHTNNTVVPLTTTTTHHNSIFDRNGSVVYNKEGDDKNEGSKDEDEDEDDENVDQITMMVNDTPPPPPRSLLSQALKTGTAKSHAAAENVRFVHNFINGIIDRELYKDMIAGLYHIYATLERLLERYAPSHFPTLHFPAELNRVESLREDMEYWHGLHWEKRMECSTPSAAVRDYVDRMNQVGRVDPLLLLSHAYTRYLGDLSGGKVLSRIARRALRLGKKNSMEGDTAACDYYDGLQFYNFERVKSAKLFKDMYRAKLDELPLSSSDVGKLVAEANVAFALNMRVFEELDVKGGVVGARVRNVREALSYYDIEMKDDDDDDARRGEALNEVAEDDGEEAKCPFGFGSGPNPHQRRSVVATKEAAKEIMHQSSANTLSTSRPSSSQAGEEGRCPWPFVFFHDPMTGARDWQTWFVIGLALCYAWNSVHRV